MPVQIPTMPGNFIFGSMREFNRDTLEFMLKARQYGDFVKFYFGPFPVYVASHPDVAHDIMVTNAASYYKSSITKQVLNQAVGSGLFTNDGDSWKRQRKLAQPAFHTKRIAAYADTMVDYAQQQIAPWQDGKTLDMEREMTALTMKIVGKTLFDAEVTEEDDIGTAVRTVLRTVDIRFNRLLPLPEWLPTPENRQINRAMVTLNRVIQQYIDERRRTGEDRGDLLSMLMAAQDDDNGSGMSDKQLHDEAMTVFGAGHETTSGALTWTLYLLSQHPEIEAKLHEEVDRLNGRAPTFADLPNLPYSDMVVKEAMRLFPPAWGVTREPIEDVTPGGYAVKKGAVVFINIYGIHRDERFFPNPERFMPERFSPENEKSIPKYAYLPFGAGPRVCIGNMFAMMEARLILATIAQRFKLALAPGQQVAPERVFTLRPKFGMQMVATLREPERVAAL
jgi:cytochrome P450